MNSNLIDFIDYDETYRNDFYPKLEIEFENPKPSERFEGNFFEDPFQQNLNPPALDRLDSNIFNSIFQSESQQTSLYYQSSESDYHHHHHNSQIIREKKEDLSTTSDDASTIHNMPEPISSKSKRIMKREKAKERSQQKQKQKMLQEVQKQQKEKVVKAEKEDKSEGGFKLTEEAILSGEIPAKFIPEGFSANMDEKTKKKMIQMIRNRISAQNSRDRKKNLIDSLEAREKELMDENLKLKMRVKQLEAEKVLLVRENQKFKKAFESAACAFEQSSNDIFSDELAENPFSQNSDPPTGGSPDMSGNSSPVYRRGMRSGGFMKYSLALATIFAVLMFNGINAPMNQQLPAVDLINVPQEPVFQVPAPKYARAERILEEAPKLEIVLPDAKSQSLMIKMEEEYPATQPCGATDLNNYPFISQISNLQQNFNEKYMSKFFSQLKIVDPAVVKSFAQSLNLNIVPEKEVNFPSYLRASRRVLPDYSKTKESNQTQIVPFTGSGQKLPIINSDNFSSIFFPAGFEFQGQEAGSFVKVEDDMGATSSQKKLRIVDSEWLQLFVPKNNISVAKLSEQDGLYIDPALNDASDDNTILEVWCKVFFVRELPSGF